MKEKNMLKQKIKKLLIKKGVLSTRMIDRFFEDKTTENLEYIYESLKDD